MQEVLVSSSIDGISFQEIQAVDNFSEDDTHLRWSSCVTIFTLLRSCFLESQQTLLRRVDQYVKRFLKDLQHLLL